MPIDYKKYPPNWKKEIVPRILIRDRHRCYCCYVKNHTIVWSVKVYCKNNKGKYGWRAIWFQDDNEAGRLSRIGQMPVEVMVVLTIAHLDHDETNHDVKDDRLAAMCQHCHLNYDAEEKMRRIMERGKQIRKQKQNNLKLED